VDTPALNIRPMAAADLDVMQTLVELAGWNQLRRDLERLWRHQPDGCFVGLLQDRVVGTVTTTSHGTEVAWIGMMLVHPDYRRRGIATALMHRAIRWLHERGTRCLKLDATPEGAAVYAQIGFCSEYGLTRYLRPARGAVTAIVPTAGPFAVPDLDALAFGANRSAWIRELAVDSRVEEVDGGYGLLRPGRLASYLGPVVAESARAARQLVERLLEGIGQAVVWDLPDRNSAAVALAQELGFTPVRRLTRMWLGKHLAAGCPELQFGLTDFATG
jgi:GNAT superfamily N-acetyltransferase